MSIGILGSSGLSPGSATGTAVTQVQAALSASRNNAVTTLTQGPGSTHTGGRHHHAQGPGELLGGQAESQAATTASNTGTNTGLNHLA